MDQAVADTRIELIRTRIEPRWSDMDAVGHINSLEYLGYMQECRVKWLLEMDLSYSESTPVLVNLHGEFKAELNYPDSLDVVMYGKAPGRSSFMSEYELWSRGHAHSDNEGNTETLCATGYAKLVWIDIERRRPTDLPEIIRTRLQ
jgi:acyl-CoA thioester hydrolase